MIDWPETRLRLQLWLHRAWPFRAITWLRFLGVTKGKGFGRFGGNAEMDAVVKHAATSDKYEFVNVCKTVGDAIQTKEVMHLRAGHPIFDPKTDHLFTAEAAHKAFEHINVSEVGGNEIEPLTPEQYAVVANAEPVQRGKVVESLLPAEAAEIPKASGAKREEHVANLVIWGIAIAVSVTFVLAVATNFFMK